ncbi:peptide/nickel transport system substrate-binding protein [Labedella gwakjiensis]|uniref:ABC transporter substrate-binding protein n=1 Tax=Labedella gwakjiensis TaxID=390269 RepID=A0A2P8GWR1_9MICO|nr:ABC transporter substrate-binding protein [Labedella gwakjiensis]PSL38392.1 peptide/nickel transport system substrate-binding protein [Labedella gwakjiensis]RUQ87081.1 ABC transporter substrate-binding protein [Labedella gwakjiensis]
MSLTSPTARPPGSQPRTRRSLRRRALAAIAVGAAAVLVATGCSIQVTSQPDPTIPDDTMLINADRGNPLFDRNFNPYLTNTRTASRWMYEPLIMINPLDNEQTPWLASEWSLPDPATIEMTIRDGVEWSDGEPLTADDVAFTFEMLKEFPAVDIKGAWQHIESIDVDGDTLTFHLLTDDVPALTIIGATYIVPEHIWKDVDDPGTWRNENPVGSGPFTLGNYNQQQYSMDKNEDYWQADKIEIEHLILPATNTQLDTVTRGYDWAYSFISDVEGTWGAASDDNEWWFPAAGIIGLMPNHDVEPFDDVNVRRGISLALERSSVAESATEGYMEPAGQTGLILPNQEDQLDPSIPDQGMIAQDTDAALAEFEKSGYTLQDDRLIGPDGEQFSFALTTANGYSDWTRAAQEVQRQLGAIGIEVTLNLPQPAGYQQAISNGDYEVAIGGMGGGNAYQAFNSLLSSEFYVPVGEATQNNFERYQNPQADELLAEFKAASDPDRQVELSQQLQNIVYDDLPVIGLYYGGSWGLFSDRKFTGWPSAEDPYMAPQNYDSAPLLIFTRLTLVKEDDQ